nr:4'-phosphopantetheinyl transferase Sfp [uncultured bacterium]
MMHRSVDCFDLSVDEIHVWTALMVNDHHLTTDLLHVLDQEERARAARFSFERDRIRFVQAHGIVRQILANYSHGDAATLTFARNRYGKPYLVPRPDGPNLQFSVSHSDDCCVLAVRLDHSIGVDVEKMRNLPQAMDIARNYFTAAESRAIAALQGTAQRDAFLVLWTHKEATVKGLGIGLAANLSRVEFDLDPVGDPRLIGWDGDPSVAQKWSVLRFDPAPGYVAAVASMHPIRSLTLQNWKRTGAD